MKKTYTKHRLENNLPLEITARDLKVDTANSGVQPELGPKPLLPDSCQFQKSELRQYQTINSTKKDAMVYVLSKENQSICVIDSQNKVTTFHLLAGESKSVYGSAPFTVVSSDLYKFDLYFQGLKVKINELNARVIRFEMAGYLTAYH